MQACVRARVFARAAGAAFARAPYLYVCMYENMYLYECARRFHRSVPMCVSARAGVVWPSVQMCVCIDACTDALIRTRTRASAAPCAFVCSPSPRVCARGWICMRVSMARYRRACIGITWICIYMYIAMSISLLYIYDVHICMHACTWACTDTSRTGIDMCVYPGRCHAHRWVHVCLSPSVQLNI
jgi:hypothetical protein